MQGIKITWKRGSEGKTSYSLFFSELELDIWEDEILVSQG